MAKKKAMGVSNQTEYFISYCGAKNYPACREACNEKTKQLQKESSCFKPYCNKTKDCYKTNPYCLLKASPETYAPDSHLAYALSTMQDLGKVFSGKIASPDPMIVCCVETLNTRLSADEVTNGHL